MNKKEVTYQNLSKWHRFLLIFISGAGSGIIYIPIYMKNVRTAAALSFIHPMVAITLSHS